MNYRNRIVLILIALFTLSLTSGVMAQDQEDETETELTETYDSGAITVNFPAEWFVSDNGTELYVSNQDLSVLETTEDYPAGLVIIRITTVSSAQVSDLEGDTAMDLAEYIEFGTELEDIELDGKDFVRTDIGDDTIDALAYVSVMSEDVFGLYVVNAANDEMPQYQDTIEGIISSASFAVIADFPEETLTRYEGIETGFDEHGFPQLGDPDAPVTVMEISSFDCSHCREWHESVLDSVIERVRAGEAKLVYVNFFGSGGYPDGEYAALSAYCVAKVDTDAFWLYHDALFSWQKYAYTAFIGPRLTAGVEALGIDFDAWTECYNSEDDINTMIEAYTYAQEVPDFVGTPTILVNDVIVVSSIESINQAIDDALAAGE